MPTFLPSFRRASTPRSRLLAWRAPVAVVACVTAVTLAACSSDDTAPLAPLVSDDSGVDATMPVVTNDAGGDDADFDGAPACDASVEDILTEVASSGYASCAHCLEQACDAPLKACYMDCTCTQEALGLFTCIGSGGSPEICATALISGSNESQILQFVGCSHICGTECVPDAAVDIDAADAGDAGDASDSGDAGHDGGDADAAG